MSIPINHHYVPKFYLTGFTNPKSNRLHVYKKSNGYWQPQGVKNVACESYLYSYTDHQGEWHHEIEQMFSKLETRFAPVVAKIVSGDTLTSDEEYTFAVFVMLTWNRVPAVVDHFNDFNSEIARRLVELHYQRYSANPDELERWKEEYQLRTGKTELSNLRAEDSNPDKLRIKHSWHQSLGIMLQSAVDLSDVVCKMGWTFCESSHDEYFIASDRPCSVINGGLGSANVELSLPLSRNIAFVAGWHSEGRRRIGAPRHLVEAINIRTASGATRELIAAKSNFPGCHKPLVDFYHPKS